MELFEVTIEVTQRCPNRCIYCSSSSDLEKTEFLSLNTILQIIDDAVTLGAKQINISGGEPLLRPDIIDIVRYVKSKGLYVRIYSSGIYYDAQYSSVPEVLLRALNGNVDSLIFNYETSSAELYAKIMGTVPANLALLEESIKRAVDNGLTVEAHLVPMRCNFRQIPHTLERVYSLGADKVSILRFVSQGRAVGNEEDTALSVEEETELRTMLHAAYEKYGDCLRLGKPYRTGHFVSCSTGTIRLVVRYDGFVFPCGAFKDGAMIVCGYNPDNVKEKRLADIYANSNYITCVRKELARYYEGQVTEPCFGQYWRENNRYNSDNVLPISLNA